MADKMDFFFVSFTFSNNSRKEVGEKSIKPLLRVKGGVMGVKGEGESS